MKQALLLLLVLNVLLQLPWAMHVAIEPWLALIPVGELALLAAACLRWPTRGVRLMQAAVVALMLIELDRIVGVYLMSHDPLFYDQLFLMQHFFVLLADLWTPVWTLAAAGILAGMVLGGWILGRLVRLLAAALPDVPAVAWRRGAGLLVAGTLLLAVMPERTGPVRWISAEVAGNVVQSVQIWRGVRAAPEASPYHAFDAVSLTRRPDVRFYVVESYGRILADTPQTAPVWREAMADIEGDLAAAGWHSVSAYSTAPVSGGRSWLADGSVFLGMPIAYESVYRHTLQRIEQIPDMVDFFDARGYRTVRLAPKDRARPGIQLTNDFHFQQPLGFADLHYTGPALGWGWIPDQYSLGVLEEEVLSGGPLFLFFHMVSSHIPWEVPPPILDDWRALTMLEGEIPEEDGAVSEEALRQLKRYRRNKRDVVRTGSDPLTLQSYTDAVLYDLEIIRRHLREDDRDALIIVMGDHQPPLVTRGQKKKRRNRDVPVHVLSRDPALLDELTKAGFVSGMIPQAEEKTALHHAGMYSLLVRTLAACCGDGGALPEYRAEGVRPHP